MHIPTHTPHAITLAVLTHTRPPKYLPACPGDDCRSVHTRMPAARLRLLVPTDLESAPSPLPPTPHTTRHNVGYTNTFTAIKLPDYTSWRCSLLCAYLRGRQSLTFGPTVAPALWHLSVLRNGRGVWDAMTLAILTPSRVSNYLHAPHGDSRHSLRISMLTAPLLPLLLTDLGSAPSPSRSHTTHATHHSFGYAKSHTATKLPACIS